MNNKAVKKGKQITLYINRDNYEKFTEINRLRGVKTNTVLNQLIENYIAMANIALPEEK